MSKVKVGLVQMSCTSNKSENLAKAIAGIKDAAAAGAQAQSSVTLFGVVDASLVRMSSDTNRVTGLSSGGQSSSRLGLRRVGDLGDRLEGGVWPEGCLATGHRPAPPVPGSPPY